MRVSAIPKDTIQIPFTKGPDGYIIFVDLSLTFTKLTVSLLSKLLKLNNILINLSCLSDSFLFFLSGMDLEGLGSFGTQSEYKFKRGKEGWWCEVKRKGSELFLTYIYVLIMFSTHHRTLPTLPLRLFLSIDHLICLIKA